MNKNSMAIIVLCSFIGAKEQNVSPLLPNEWSSLARRLMKNKYEPVDLLNLNDKIINDLGLSDELVIRINNLVSRSSSLTFDLAKYERLGIKCVTRACNEYPKIFKDMLGNSCPPLIYYCGDLNLINDKFIGFVGSRNISDSDKDIDKILVTNCVKKGYGIISGGANGVDNESFLNCMELGGKCILVLSDSMLKRLKDKDYIEYIRKNKLLCLSLTVPECSFNVGMAMMRNKYIYLLSKGTVIISSDYNKGGTWNGAVECLKKGYSSLCVVDNKLKGNTELIKLGAKAIDKDWDVSFDVNKINLMKKDDNEQLSLL